jgi:sugar phosphate isomerase/epimerase
VVDVYKTLAPGIIGFGKSFMEAALPMAEKGFEGYWFGIEGDSKTPAEETRDMLKKSGLRPAGFTLPVEFRRDEATFESGMANLEGYARYAADIGALGCITWILPGSNDLDYAANFELHRARLSKIAKALQEYNIRFGLEFVGPAASRKNAKHTFIYRLDQTLELCDAIGTDNMGVLLDIFHWDLAGHTLADFKQITDPKKIVLVHINDAPAGIPLDEMRDGKRCLPGETGVLRITEFFDGLKSVGYTGPVMPEPFDSTLQTLPFEQALRKVMDSMELVWP